MWLLPAKACERGRRHARIALIARPRPRVGRDEDFAFVGVRAMERMDISIVVARILVEELSRREVDEDRFCREAGLDPAALDDSLARLSFRTWNGIVAHALEVTNDPQLGLFVGSRTRAIALSPVVALLASCATSREAADLLVRYAPLMVEGARWKLEVRNGIASLSCELPKALVHRAYEYEACLSLAYSVMLPYLRNESPLEVCFEHDRTGPIGTYRRVFDSDARFATDENAIRGGASAYARCDRVARRAAVTGAAPRRGASEPSGSRYRGGRTCDAFE
jgi:hypothetical protein